MKNLGITGVPVYPERKYSTVTAMGKFISSEQIKHSIAGDTLDMFERYFHPDNQRPSKQFVKLYRFIQENI